MVNLRITSNINVTCSFRPVKLSALPVRETTVVFEVFIGLILHRGNFSHAQLMLGHVHFFEISCLPRHLSRLFLPFVEG